MENMPQMCNYIWPKKSCRWMPALCSDILFSSPSCPLGIPSKQSPASPGDKHYSSHSPPGELPDLLLSPL